MNLGTNPNSNENTKDWWDAKYRDSKGESLYPKEPSSFLMQYLDLLPKGAITVDLATGEGRNAIALALRGMKVAGIDFSEVAIERAQKIAADSGAQVEFKKKDLDFFLPDLMSFDAITCIDFKPPPTLLKNLIRGLKKDGFLFVETYLTTACKERKDLEVFEAFRPGELLQSFSGAGLNFRVIYYSELGPKNSENKVYMIAKKTELL